MNRSVWQDGAGRGGGRAGWGARPGRGTGGRPWPLPHMPSCPTQTLLFPMHMLAVGVGVEPRARNEDGLDVVPAAGGRSDSADTRLAPAPPGARTRFSRASPAELLVVHLSQELALRLRLERRVLLADGAAAYDLVGSHRGAGAGAGAELGAGGGRTWGHLRTGAQREGGISARQLSARACHPQGARWPLAWRLDASVAARARPPLCAASSSSPPDALCAPRFAACGERRWSPAQPEERGRATAQCKLVRHGAGSGIWQSAELSGDVWPAWARGGTAARTPAPLPASPVPLAIGVITDHPTLGASAGAAWWGRRRT